MLRTTFTFDALLPAKCWIAPLMPIAVYKFEARYSNKTPKVKVLQTAYICKKKAYIITISLSNTIIEIDKYEGILKTFKCKTEW